MRTTLSSFASVLAVVLLACACAGNPQPAAPAPQATPAPAAAQPSAPTPAAPAPAAAPAAVDLSGDWSFVIDFPGQRMVGVIQLRRSGSSYAGTATPADVEGSATLTLLTISGNRVVMEFESPDGAARAEAVLADPRTMNGTVTYAGNTGPFTARKQ